MHPPLRGKMKPCQHSGSYSMHPSRHRGYRSLFPEITVILNTRIITFLFFFPIKALQLILHMFWTLYEWTNIVCSLVCGFCCPTLCLWNSFVLLHSYNLFIFIIESQHVNEYSTIYTFTVKGYLSLQFEANRNRCCKHSCTWLLE